MKCPNCKVDMAQVKLETMELPGAQHCEQCGGFWVSEADLKGLEPGLWENIENIGLETAEALSSVICPHCAAQCVGVTLTNHPEFTVDRCPGCHGFWLDRGELESLHAAVVEFGEASGTLEHKPPEWSGLYWIAYRLGQDWMRRQRGAGPGVAVD